MEKLKHIVSEILDIEYEMIDESLQRNVLAEWDSFNHLMLISEIEGVMGIKFSMKEVESIKTMGELFALVKIKGA